MVKWRLQMTQSLDQSRTNFDITVWAEDYPSAKAKALKLWGVEERSLLSCITVIAEEVKE